MCVQDIDVQCVLQFTLIHAAGCALHRHTSRVIHRLELCSRLLLGSSARTRRRARTTILGRASLSSLPSRLSVARKIRRSLGRPSETRRFFEPGRRRETAVSSTRRRRRRRRDRYPCSVERRTRASATIERLRSGGRDRRRTRRRGALGHEGLGTRTRSPESDAPDGRSRRAARSASAVRARRPESGCESNDLRDRRFR